VGARVSFSTTSRLEWFPYRILTLRIDDMLGTLLVSSETTPRIVPIVREFSPPPSLTRHMVRAHGMPQNGRLPGSTCLVPS
jgi:hypothetical protein